jgi:hypothetical protein
MGWKNWPAWLKGGIIGGGILFVLMFSFNIMLLGGKLGGIISATGASIAGFILGGLIGSFFSKNYILKLGSMGAIFGFLIWFYDYDFLINMGGPNTPISDSISRFFGIDFLFFPLIFLIAVFGIVGALIGGLIELIKKKSSTIEVH